MYFNHLLGILFLCKALLKNEVIKAFFDKGIQMCKMYQSSRGHTSRSRAKAHLRREVCVCVARQPYCQAVNRFRQCAKNSLIIVYLELAGF